MTGGIATRARAASDQGRGLAALLGAATLGAIAWHAYRALPQGRQLAGFSAFMLTFSGGFALPYLVSIALLVRRDGRDGLRLALATAIVNAAWALPLGALLVLFGGFTMGNRDQIEEIAAVAVGALLQLPLGVTAAVGLRRIARRGRASPVTRRGWSLAWPAAFALPIVASGGSWAYARVQLAAIPARAEQAMRNDRAAQDAVASLRDCLSRQRERGYPATLDACPDSAVRFGDASGYRVEYLPAVPGTDGRIGAYLLCAQPLRFRETGYQTWVADASDVYGAGAGADASPDASPTCASVLGAGQAIRYCAYDHAAHAAARGYPARLAEVADCVARGRALAALGPDTLTTQSGESYAYLADPPDAHGAVTQFRIYSLRGRLDSPQWIDERGSASAAPVAPDAALERLPASAAPEAFAPGCERGGAEDCFLAGYEWDRRASQTAKELRDPALAPMHEQALQAFARGCDLGHAHACERLALGIEDGLGAPRDPRRALAIHERACDLGNADGCRGAASIRETGREGAPGAPSAERGQPVPRDVARAVALYQRACDLADSDGCFIAARLLASGEGIAPDPARALALFAGLCRDGMAIACSRAATLAPDGQAEYRRRACVLGDADACS